MMMNRQLAATSITKEHVQQADHKAITLANVSEVLMMLSVKGEVEQGHSRYSRHFLRLNHLSVQYDPPIACCLPKGNKSLFPPRKLYTKIDSNFFCGMSKLEETLTPRQCFE